MWTYEHSVDTTARAAAIWRLWSDVASWKTWHANLKSVVIDGSFEPGTEFVMNLDGEQPVRLRLAEVVPLERFVDEAHVGDVVVRTAHRFEPSADGRAQVTYRMEISGPGADELGPQLGPAITADFPETITALVRLAEKG
jgi:uncharacterized protein YndB with AHSA1/START domain